MNFNLFALIIIVGCFFTSKKLIQKENDILIIKFLLTSIKNLWFCSFIFAFLLWAKQTNHDLVNCTLDAFQNKTQLDDYEIWSKARHQCWSIGLYEDNYKLIKLEDFQFSIYVRKLVENEINSTSIYYFLKKKKEQFNIDNFVQNNNGILTYQVILILLLSIFLNTTKLKTKFKVNLIVFIQILNLIYYCQMMKIVFFGETSFDELKTKSFLDTWFDFLLIEPSIIIDSICNYVNLFIAINSVPFSFIDLETAYIQFKILKFNNQAKFNDIIFERDLNNIHIFNGLFMLSYLFYLVTAAFFLIFMCLFIIKFIIKKYLKSNHQKVDQNGSEDEDDEYIENETV